MGPITSTTLAESASAFLLRLLGVLFSVCVCTVCGLSLSLIDLIPEVKFEAGRCVFAGRKNHISCRRFKVELVLRSWNKIQSLSPLNLKPEPFVAARKDAWLTSMVFSHFPQKAHAARCCGSERDSHDLAKPAGSDRGELCTARLTTKKSVPTILGRNEPERHYAASSSALVKPTSRADRNAVCET